MYSHGSLNASHSRLDHGDHGVDAFGRGAAHMFQARFHIEQNVVRYTQQQMLH